MTDTHENHATIRYTADVVAVTDGDEGKASSRAAVRELEEETCVRVTEDELRLVGIWDQPDRDPRGRYVTVAYLATVPAGT
ncbi:NUDIX domain-containing protein [Streptomyces sp. NPDC088707]|uniref:NUDIX domain-containing protein n=1 Tax=Streptomyces sp. NPDC088707 TaxID=3365871 RepID=UPI0038214088